MPIDMEVQREYLERCANAFMEHLDNGTFDSHMDEWTVFGGEPPKDPLGFYGTYAKAIRAGYDTYQLQSFMVRKITRAYKIFGRGGVPMIASGKLAELVGRQSHAHPRSIFIK